MYSTQSQRGTTSRMRAALIRDLALVFGLGVGLMILLNRAAFLPARFRGDETTIQELAQQIWETPEDDSYSSVAFIYRILGLADQPLLASLIGFCIGCIPYFLIFRGTSSDSYGKYTAPILIFGVIMTAVYMGTYSKEVFVVPIVILFIVLKAGSGRMLVILTAVCCYAEFVRNYWFFLAASILVLLASQKLFRSWTAMFWTSAALVLAGSAFITAIMGVPADYFRTSVNLFREATGDVNSLIPRYVEFPEPVGGILNNLLSFVVLQVPIPLLLKASPYYLLLSFVIGMLWIIFYRSVLSSNIINMSDRDLQTRFIRCVCLLLSFVVTQSFFEPDYGSALKHLTPLIPVLLWVYVHSNTRSPIERGLRKVSQ